MKDYLSTMVLVIFAVLTPQLSNATITGMVTPYFYGSGFYINVSGAARTSIPSCVGRSWIVTLSVPSTDPSFSGYVAILMAAYYAGRPVYMDMTGNCDGQGLEIVQSVIPQ